MIRAYKAEGFLSAILSGILYGCMPIGASVLYSKGVTPIALVFLRNALAIPFLALICAFRKAPGIKGRSVLKAAVAGSMGCAATPLLLYLSYTGIDTGIATTLHYVYPAIVMLLCSVLFHDRMRPKELFCLFLSMAGVAFLSLRGGSMQRPFGFVCAACSGLTFAVYVTMIGKTELRDADPFRLALICCASASVLLFPFLLTGEKTGLPESADGWILSAAFAVMVCCAAMTLFKKATQLIGPQMAGILSTFEPLTGIVAGVLFLGESFGPIQFAGSLLILSSVILLSLRH